MKRYNPIDHPLLRGPLPGDRETRHQFGSAAEGRRDIR